MVKKMKKQESDQIFIYNTIQYDMIWYYLFIFRHWY